MFYFKKCPTVLPEIGAKQGDEDDSSYQHQDRDKQQEQFAYEGYLCGIKV